MFFKASFSFSTEVTGLDWKIEQECPQCGGPVVLEETDRILSCPFCRTRLWMNAKGFFRYYIPPPKGTDGHTVFIPYWRIRGLSYAYRLPEIKDRYIDANWLAVDLKGLPSSLGLRPQAMRMRFVAPATPGVFLEPTRPFPSSATRYGERDGESGCDSLIGETISLIYTPMAVKNDLLYDAVLDKPVAPWIPDDSRPLGPTDPEMRFIPALCPQCGWNLQGERDAVIMTCENCRTLWSLEKEEMEQLPFAFLDGTGEPLHYLPFWRMSVQISGLQAASLADFIRIANLPKRLTPAMEEKPLYFWSPAFKVNPALFLRWSRQMTVFQPDEKDLNNRWPAARLYPANLPREEAVESVRVILGNIVTDKRAFLKNLPNIRISALDMLLVYHPFIVGKRELTHERMGVVIEKNALKYGASM